MLFSSVTTILTTWELPVFVLVSLLLQMALIPMGYYRKYTSNHWLRRFLWLFYLTADWITTASLGILSNYHYERLSEPVFVIRAVWAPFLLLHMGGPDTITAFSMQDNDLWLRHFLNMFVQGALASYVYFRALKPTSLNFIAIPIFVSGIIKYCERTWAFRSASIPHLRDQLIPTYDDSSDYLVSPTQHCFEEVKNLHVAYKLFLRNKWVFADLILSTTDLQESLRYFRYYDSKTAFNVVEVELGFMHDFFYTKASLIHTYWGAMLRLATLSTTLIAIATFCTTDRRSYPTTDVYLTLILLFGALGVELFSVFLLICSDWFVVWLTKFDHSLARFTFKIISSSGLWSIHKRRWANFVPQYNLTTRCIQDINHVGCTNFLRISEIAIMDSRPISDEFKNRIFQRLKEMTGVRNEAQTYLLQDLYCIYEKLDSDENILLWHIATDICYHFGYEHANAALKSKTEDMKLLSDYLMYILVNRRSLFPNGTSKMRIDNTVEDVIIFFIEEQPMTVDAYNNIRNIRKV